MSWWEILLLSLVEGLTEFLPVSSTGHLILVSTGLGKNEDLFYQNFNIIIQFGAILSVVVLYFRRFLTSLSFYQKLFIAFLPAAVFGFAFKSALEKLLGSPWVVAWSLIAGGVILIFSDRWFPEQGRKKIEDLGTRDLLWIGCFQCLALIPGVSRSAASILGGLSMGLSRKEAAEFSFFLAVPTLSAASFYKTYKAWPTLDASQTGSLLLGCLLSFIFAGIAIRFFISVVSRFGYRWFGFYRLLLGGLVLVLLGGNW